eukprot:scaffold183212_cov33-Tisochrysis_lutea.AAC.3
MVTSCGARLFGGGTGHSSVRPQLMAVGAPSHGRIGGAAPTMGRSSIAAGWAAGEEGRGARSMTLSNY